ncbi:MAG: calcium/sodium antiporter [Bacteroidota bacterium]
MLTELFTYGGLFIISLIVLLKGSDWFVDSAEEIGLSLGISPFLIGVTIVAFGTSLPELAASVASVLAGESKIVVANVVGSNITNIALVLGITTLVAKEIKLEYNIWHVDMPYLWGSAFLLWLVLLDLKVSVAECILFLGGIIIFLAYSFKQSEKGGDRPKASLKSYGLFVLGGIFVWVGAEYTIQAITNLSNVIGIGTEVIALTAIALGTSLPEVIVSINAARKGKTSIAVGNVLGSNMFNTYVVMAIPGLLGNLEIPPQILEVSLPLMVVMTVIFGMVSNNKNITRWEGVLLLLFYAFFLVESFK